MLFFAATCALGSDPAAAQWRVDAQAGRLQYEAAPDEISTTVALGLSRVGFSSSYGLSVGLPLAGDDPVWGALSGYHRFAFGRTAGLGVDVAGNGFAYRIGARDSIDLPLLDDETAARSGGGVGAEILPLAFWQSPSGRLGAEARAGVVGFVAFAEQDAYERVAFLSDAALTTALAPTLTARLDGRWVRVDQSGFPFVGLGATWTPGPALWGSVGRWLHDSIEGPSWEAGAAWSVSERVSLSVTGSQDALDPIYATPARTNWSAGVTVRLGRVASAMPEPVPASYVDGVATITLGDEVEGVPWIAGDFNQWVPVEMEREDGMWVHRVALSPGVYNYAFVDQAGTWFVPEDTPGRHSDGMGGYVAVLIVPEQ